MARYRRTRKYTRSRRGRWSPNIQEIRTTQISTSTQGIGSTSQTLAFNPIQTNTATSQVYTVKNFDINFVFDGDIAENVGKIEDIAAYIMFVPQGMQVTSDYNLQHPEYIMAHKFVGSPSGEFNGEQQYQPIRVKTRLSFLLNLVLTLIG